MNGIRKNIFFSILIHAAVISAVFSTLGSSNISRKDFISILLLEGLHQTEKAGENRASPAKPDINKKETTEEKKKAGPLKEATSDTDIGPLRASNPRINENIPPAQPVTGDKPVSISTDQIQVPTGQVSKTSGENISLNFSRGNGSLVTVSTETRAGVYHETGNTDYINAIRSAIKKNLIYPSLARRNRIEGTVLTEFSIDNNGIPENIRVVKSSGFNVLDSAAVQTINKASPFPVIKEAIEIPITFVLKK